MKRKADWFLEEVQRRLAGVKDDEKDRAVEELRKEIQDDLDSGKRSDLVEGFREFLLGSGVVECISSD